MVVPLVPVVELEELLELEEVLVEVVTVSVSFGDCGDYERQDRQCHCSLKSTE